MKKGFTNHAVIHDAANRHLQNEIEKKNSKLSRLRGLPTNAKPLKRHNTRTCDTEKLCDYELGRLDKMRKNHEIMVQMGIEKEKNLKAKRPRKQTNSCSVMDIAHKMNLRSHIPETSNESSFFSDTLDVLKKSRRKNRANEDVITHNTTSHDPTVEESTLNEKMIDDDPTCFVNDEYNPVNDDSKGENIGTNTFPQSNLNTTFHGEENVTTTQVNIEDSTCFFDHETYVCNIEAKDLSNVLIQSFPIIKSSFAKSGYTGVHKIKLGWLVQININRDDLTKDPQMCFCGIYAELAIATFVFSMISQRLFLASSIDFLYNTLNNLKILSSGSDDSFLYT